MTQTNFVIRGVVLHTPTFDRFEYYQDAYIVCENSKVVGLFEYLPERYKSLPLLDRSGKIIIPGMCDMHQHAPQYAFRGLGQNIENPEWDSWFDLYAFPEEKRYQDEDYARRAYGRLVKDLLQSTTTRVCTFATIHRRSTEVLMQLLEDSGLCAYVGKVNMDRNSAEGLLETTEETIQETRFWLEDCKGRYTNVRPIITPRYTPSCSDEAMAGLSKLAEKFQVPVQSHLSEGLDEIAWVHQLMPDISFYGEAYSRFGMMRQNGKTIMAHCVFSSEKEIEALKQNDVLVVHCPDANLNYSGVAAPILRYVREGLRVGLGTDVSGGHTLNMLQIVAETILASKVHWAYTEQRGRTNAKRDVLSLANAFYLATKGGGSFWGKVGSFEEGYAFDAVVLDDTRLADEIFRSPYERLERLICMGDDRETYEKFVNGILVYQKEMV